MILGIDYGKRKIGLAIADMDSKLAEPLKVVKVSNVQEAIKKVSQVAQVSKVSQIILGVSEGNMAEESHKFGKMLEAELKLPVIFQDETLSTKSAQELSFSSGMKRKKRKGMEDAYAATVVLQSYLDSFISNFN